ncbi:hypothetical protein AMTRI_Chr09g20580 [Amborella trichopoda]
MQALSPGLLRAFGGLAPLLAGSRIMVFFAISCLVPTLYGFKFQGFQEAMKITHPNLIMARVSHYHVAATLERYWAQALPNTPMPDAIRARFRPVPSGLLCMGSGNHDPRFLYSDVSQENRDPRETTLFLEKDLKIGMNKIIYFRKSEFSCASPFLSREDADAIPFSSAELPRILQHFSFPPASSEAVEVGVTLTWCELLEALEKCLTSLEAMIDYATPSVQDPNITFLRTCINKDSVLQAYTATKVQTVPTKASSTLCHNMPYPYAGYYCH